MKNKKKALLLASIASLGILCGCGKEKHKTIETEDGTYIETNGEYVKVEVLPKVYEPGTHIIQFVHKNSDGYSYDRSYLIEGFDNLLFAPEVPEGYKAIGSTSYSTNDGFDNYTIYIMVNEVTVEVEGRYDVTLNSILYNTPGKIIEEKTLGLGD